MDFSQLEIVVKFNKLLSICYAGKLIDFCDDFDIKNTEGFYKKVQKNRNRMLKQKVSERTLDDFKKYIMFLEGKKILNESSREERAFLISFQTSLNDFFK